MLSFHKSETDKKESKINNFYYKKIKLQLIQYKNMSAESGSLNMLSFHKSETYPKVHKVHNFFGQKDKITVIRIQKLLVSLTHILCLNYICYSSFGLFAASSHLHSLHIIIFTL